MRFPHDEALGLQTSAHGAGALSCGTSERSRSAGAFVAPWTPERVRGDDRVVGNLLFFQHYRHPGLVPGSTVQPQLPFTFRAKRRQAQRNCQIIPGGIVALNQIHLPLPRPFFDAFLTGDSGFHGAGGLEPDETLDGVAIGEAAERSFTVLDDARKEIGRNAGLKNAVKAAGENVDGRKPISHGCFMMHGGPRNKSGVTAAGEWSAAA